MGGGPEVPEGEPGPGPGLHPRTPARRAAGRAGALLRAIRAVLRVALANRGNSVRDFVDAEGRSGDNTTRIPAATRHATSTARAKPT